jgi:hypothetical protein
LETVTITPKTSALALLGLVSFAGPILERGWTGRVEGHGGFDLAITVVSISLIFWWYHADKHERDYHAGPLMNIGVIALALLALPIYFIRSRGWKRGLIATAFAAGILAILLGLSELGERIGAAL